MRKFYEIMCVVVFILASTNVFAFDGKRKGFIIGGGIGGGFLSNKTSFGSFSDTESQGVFLTKLKIGYAPSNTLEIYWIANSSWWRENDMTLFLGVSAIAVTKYLDNTSETGLFVTGGIGFSEFDAPFEGDVDASTGFGLIGGVGYEFSRHWSIEADLLYSKVEESGVDFDSFGVRVSVNVLAF